MYENEQDEVLVFGFSGFIMTYFSDSIKNPMFESNTFAKGMNFRKCLSPKRDGKPQTKNKKNKNNKNKKTTKTKNKIKIENIG